MFTYVKLKNFKSFGNVEFNFKNTETEVKKLAVIYGENGSGKTNFVKAFEFLRSTLDTMLYPDTSDEIDEKENRIYMRNYVDLFKLNTRIQEIKMIGNDDDIEIEYGFNLNNADGYYRLVLNDNKVKSEKLYYIIEKRRNFQFEINLEKEKIKSILNPNIFIGKEYKNELENEINKYWGKNTLLSILSKEIKDKNKNFIEENVSENLLNVITMFKELTVVLNSFRLQTRQSKKRSKKVLMRLERGNILIEKERKLNLCENILRDFFTQTYSEIKDVYYMRTRYENSISYKLYFKKMIANRLIDIEYTEESAGTLKILNQFNSIIGTLWGETVIIDEIDSGIHDLLMKAIIESLKNEITGQLIITTHNTLLLESLDKKDIYIITTDYEGQKRVNSINDYEFKVQKNHNIRELYLKGLFGGIPSVNEIDFTEIKEQLNSEDELKGGNNAEQ